MTNQVRMWLAAHGVVISGITSALIGFAFRHYWPIAKAWLNGPAVDDLIMEALGELKSLLVDAGASPDEIKSIEAIVSQIALRASKDIEEDEGKTDQKPPEVKS